MGAVLPIIMIAIAAASATAAVYAAIAAVSVIAIIAAVAAVAATAASIYFYVQGDLRNSMLFAGIGAVAGIAGIYVVATQSMAAATAQMVEGTTAELAAVQAVQESAAFVIYSYAQTIYAGFQSFLEIIHFKTLLAVNDVLFLVSQDYRNMMQGVFIQLSRVGESLGYGSTFMLLCFRDMRNLVMDVSASIGKTYDLAEITYMTSFGEFLSRMSTRMDTYQNNPHQFLLDLDAEVYKPGVDLKARAVQAMLSGIDSALVQIKLVAEDATKIRNDLLKLASDMPAVIKDQVLPAIRAVTDQVDKFIRLTYDPRVLAIEKSFKQLGDSLGEQQRNVGKLTDKIARPGKYIEGIKDLPRDEQLDDILSLSRTYEAAVAPEFQEINTTADWIMRESEATIFTPLPEFAPIPKPPLEKLHPYGTVPPTVTPKKTWFVGDY